MLASLKTFYDLRLPFFRKQKYQHHIFGKFIKMIMKPFMQLMNATLFSATPSL